MLKGISRQIIEVIQTENPYFERAFLVVRPVCQEMPAEKLDKAACRFLEETAPHSGLKRARQQKCFFGLLFLLLGGALGAALTILFSIL